MLVTTREGIQITLTEEQILKAAEQIKNKQKPAICCQKPITEVVKTVKDAESVLKEKNSATWVVGAGNDIYTACGGNIASEKRAECIKAFKELSLICDILNEGWIPDWRDGNYKYRIERNEGGYYLDGSMKYMKGGGLLFKDEKLAWHVVTCFKDLLDKYFMV